MFNKGDKMSVDLREIAIKTEEINKDFSEALEILKELFKNGVKPSDESIKNAINEVLTSFNFIKQSELKEKLEALLEELNINANINEESLKEVVLKVVLENQESLKGDKGEDGDKISDEKLRQTLEEVSKPLLEESFHQVGNTINNTLSIVSNALEKNALLCNITNTPPPEQTQTNNGYKKGFIWIDNSKTPNDIYVSDFTSWIKVELSKEPEVNRLRLTVQTAYRGGSVCLSDVRLIKEDKTAIYAKNIQIDKENKSATGLYDIDGKEYEVRISSTINADYGDYDLITGGYICGTNLAVSTPYEYILDFDKPLPKNIIGIAARPTGYSQNFSSYLNIEAYASSIGKPLFSLNFTNSYYSDAIARDYTLNIRDGSEITLN